jgi:hypothetical protein
MAVKVKMSSLRERALNAAASLPEELVHVPEWDDGDTQFIALVRSLTAKERAQFIRQVTAAQPGQRQQPGAVSLNWESLAADIVIMTARDPENGELLFTAPDRDALLSVAATPLERLASVARRLSGLEESSQAQAEFPA